VPAAPQNHLPQWRKGFLRALLAFFLVLAGAWDARAQRPLGTDVSGYQTSVDWAATKAGGVTFAYLDECPALTHLAVRFDRVLDDDQGRIRWPVRDATAEQVAYVAPFFPQTSRADRAFCVASLPKSLEKRLVHFEYWRPQSHVPPERIGFLGYARESRIETLVLSALCPSVRDELRRFERLRRLSFEMPHWSRAPIPGPSTRHRSGCSTSRLPT